MTEHNTFHPAFAVGARDHLTRPRALNWGAVRREARLLVPVDLQALVVQKGDTFDHADIAVKVLRAQADPTEPRAAKPFTDVPATDSRAHTKGTYLHWALPDGLTQTRGVDADGNPRWRALPNRWLIARMLYGLPHPMRYWIVESERGRSFDLEGWAEEPSATMGLTPEMAPDELTAVVGGDPAWAAVYDNVEYRFAFHDDWDRVDPNLLASPTTYVVIGWYSDPEIDPLDAAEREGGFDALVAALGWTVDPERLSAAQRDAADAASAVAGFGLASLYREVRARLELADFAPRGAPLVEQLRPWWPRQSIFHGVLYGVRTRKAPADPRPQPSNVQVSIGATSVEATARLVSDQLADDDAESQHAAFAYGISDALAQPEGVARIDEEFHARAFESLPGGERTEKVLAGDPFEDVRDPVFPTPASDQVLATPSGSVKFSFVGGASRVADLLTLKTRPERVAAPQDPRRIQQRTVPLPRFYAPQDPVILLGGLKRSLRHGYDGRFSPDERLQCRLSGDTVTKIAGLVDGRVLIERGVENGGVPPEAEALVIEAAVEDPFLDISEQTAGRLGIPYQLVSSVMTAEARLFLWSLARPGDVEGLHGYSLKDGVGASPAGINIWRQAWVPLYLEWELATELDESTDKWRLDELDYEPEIPAGLTSSSPPMLSGRSLLTSSNARALADAITAFCDAEDKLDLEKKGRLEEAVEAELRRLSQESGHVDFLSGGLDGLREQLLGYTSETAWADADGNIEAPPPSGGALLVRAGVARLQRLRVVDAFGRTLTLIEKASPTPLIGRGLRDDDPSLSDTLVLRPRLNPPSRLLLRLLDARDDTVEATVDQSRSDPPSPVAGWLLPDHADGALEFFDAAGDPLGQLLHDPLTGAVMWEGPPGHRGQLGAGPEGMGTATALRNLKALAVAVLAEDAGERAVDATRSDTPLGALLRVIDTTAETVGSGGSTGTEHLAQLTGKPVAVVRAAIRLEVQPEPDHPGLGQTERAARLAAWARLAARAFAVRLGALTRLDDGLLGYFVDDDYMTLWPVHDSVVSKATDSGPRSGDLGPVDAAAQGTKEIDSPYLVTRSDLLVRPAQTVHLTLLMDPSAKVHATCGVVPRKSIALLRDWTASALARIMPSFRVGPVLVDPTTIRMPQPAALGKRQEWSRRQSEAEWRHDPIVAATQQAMLPELAAVLQEGYVRVSLEDDQ